MLEAELSGPEGTLAFSCLCAFHPNTGSTSWQMLSVVVCMRILESRPGDKPNGSQQKRVSVFTQDQQDGSNLGRWITIPSTSSIFALPET